MADKNLSTILRNAIVPDGVFIAPKQAFANAMAKFMTGLPDNFYMPDSGIEVTDGDVDNTQMQSALTQYSVYLVDRAQIASIDFSGNNVADNAKFINLLNQIYNASIANGTANLSGGTMCGQKFLSPGAPYGLAYDGSNLWAIQQAAGTVIKFSPAGQNLGEFTVGALPCGIFFDGTYIWVSNYNDRSITQLSLDGSTVGTYFTDPGPQGIAFDGTYIWTANTGGSSVTKIRRSDGEVIGSYVMASGASPAECLYDGTHLWVISNDGNVFRVDVATGAVLNSYTVDSSVNGIAFDGTYLWTCDYLNNQLFKIDRVTGGATNYVLLDAPFDVAFDGTHIWVTMGPTTLLQIDASTGYILKTITIASSSGGNYNKVISGGGFVYVSHYSGGFLIKLDLSGNIVLSSEDLINAVNNLVANGVSVITN